MTESGSAEPTISINAIWFLIGSFLGVMLVVSNTPPYFVHGGGLLALSLVSLVGPLLYIFFGLYPSPQSDRRRFWIVAATSTILVLGLLGRQISIRGSTHVPDGIHDGAVHTEVAAQLLLQGQNPYGADYRWTPYQVLNPPIEGGPSDNVVWHHYMYPPMVILAQSAVELAARAVNSQGDFRALTIGAVFMLAAFGVFSTKSWTRRTRNLLLTIGNPLIWIYALIGANDILVVAALCGVAMLTTKKHWLAAGITMAAAAGLKQSAWIIWPLWAAWVGILYRQRRLDRRGLWRLIIGHLATLAAIFGPFLIWNSRLLWQDIVVYASGLIPYSYPISGTTALQYLHVYQVVDSPWAIIPSYVYQLAVGAPVFWVLWRWLRRYPTASNWLISNALLMLSILLVSRYLNNNYIAGIIGLLVAAEILRPASPPTEKQYS